MRLNLKHFWKALPSVFTLDFWRVNKIVRKKRFGCLYTFDDIFAIKKWAKKKGYSWDNSWYLDGEKYLYKNGVKVCMIQPFNPRKMEFLELIKRSKQKENIVVSQPISQQNRIENKDEIISSLKQRIYQKEVEIQMANQENQNLNLRLQFVLQYGTAKQRIQNQLSYKLGQVMIKNSKSLIGYVKMPFILLSITNQHKKECKIYQAKVRKNPALKLPPLEKYPDFQESLKYKNHLSYQLGSALIQANKTSWYRGGG